VRRSEFKNPSDEIVYRLYGRVDGQRIRKNSTARAEAEAERQARELARLQAATGMRVAATRLTDAQLQEAEGAFTLVKDKPQPLLFYVDYALKNYRAPEHEKRLPDAVAAHLAKKQEDHDRTLLSPRQLKSITCELGVLKRHFKTGPVSQCTPQNLTAYLIVEV
jgi:hypothetical protein